MSVLRSCVVCNGGGGGRWTGRWKVLGCDEGIQPHVHMRGASRCTYCNDCRRNALTNKILLTLFWCSFSLMTGQLNTLLEVVVDGLGKNEYHLGLVPCLITLVVPFLFAACLLIDTFNVECGARFLTTYMLANITHFWQGQIVCSCSVKLEHE